MLYELHDRPSLDEPVLVMVLEGWIDAGYAATTAAQTLLAGVDSYPVATFDTDALLDHRARRPIMHLVDGVNTGLSWPSLELRAGTDQEGNDLLLLLGAEPDHSWRAFTEATLELAQGFGARMVVGLGAYPATVPHTRPVSLSVTAASADLAAASGLLRGTLDVPAGVQAVLERRLELTVNALGSYDLSWRPGLAFVWLKLPMGWRASTFMREAETVGVLVRSADEYALMDGSAPNAIRIAIDGRSPEAEFVRALDAMARLLRNPPADLPV